MSDTIQTKVQLKTWFSDGEKPTGSQFSDAWTTFVSMNSAGTITTEQNPALNGICVDNDFTIESACTVYLNGNCINASADIYSCSNICAGSHLSACCDICAGECICAGCNICSNNCIYACCDIYACCNICAGQHLCSCCNTCVGGTLYTQNGIVGKVTNVVDTYNVLATDETIILNKATSFTITLPTAVVGQIFNLKNIGAGTVTVDGDSTDTIDGQLTQTINQWDCLIIMCSAANTWVIL